MEITKVVKPLIRRGANTFGNTVYVVLSFNAVDILLIVQHLGQLPLFLLVLYR